MRLCMTLLKIISRFNSPFRTRVYKNTVPLFTLVCRLKCPYLGVILDHRMNRKPHVEELRGKAHRSVAGMLTLLTSSLSSREKILIYKTYIRPKLIYSALVWAFITKGNMQRLAYCPKSGAQIYWWL